MKRKKLLLCLLAVILAMAVTCPAFAGTTTANMDETNGTLALVDSGGILPVDIVLGLSSDDAQVESPARLQATVESPATIPQVCSECHQVLTAKAANDEIGTQHLMITWTIQGDDGSSGGSSFHIGKDLASASTMMTGSYAMPPLMISHVHHFGPDLTMIA